MTLDAWLRSHPYLHSVAQLHAQVDAAVAEVPAGNFSTVHWEDYSHDFLRGGPLLRSSDVAIDYSPVEKLFSSFLNCVASSSLPANLVAEVGSFRNELERDADAVRHLVDGLLNDYSSPGLQRYLGWTALAQYLRPLIEVFAN